MSTCEDNTELTLGGTRYIMDKSDAQAVTDFIKELEQIKNAMDAFGCTREEAMFLLRSFRGHSGFGKD